MANALFIPDSPRISILQHEGVLMAEDVVLFLELDRDTDTERLVSRAIREHCLEVSE